MADQRRILDTIDDHGGERTGTRSDGVGVFAFPADEAAINCARALHRFVARGAVGRVGSDLFVIVADHG